MKPIIKLLLLFLGLDLLIYGIFTFNIIFIILGIINTISLLLFLNYKFNFVFKTFDLIKNSNIKELDLKKKIKKTLSFKKDLGDFYKLVKDINKHYIIILSVLVFIFVLFSKFIGYKEIELNIYISFGVLIVSVIVGFKDIVAGEIYIWNKKLKFLDYIIFASLILFYIFLNLNGSLELYERFFIASIISFAFYIFTINFLGVREIYYGKYKPSILMFSVLSISTLFFLYSFFNLKTMYNDFYVGKTIVNKEKIQLWEKVFITPDNKEFNIIKKGDLYSLKWQDNTNKVFDSFETAEEYILGNYKEEAFVDRKLDDITKNETKTLTGTMTDKELIPYLLKNKNYDDLFDVTLELPNIPSDIENYKFYNISYALGLINYNSDLSDQVFCMNYIAMYGMTERWDMEKYGNIGFFEKYYIEGIEQDIVPKECVEDNSREFKWEYLEKESLGMELLIENMMEEEENKMKEEENIIEDEKDI